jgi:hypothetical protein
MANGNGYDWEAIFKDYRLNVLSLREVARKHGVDYGYMQRQAKKHGITRDLSTRVKNEVQAQLVSNAVTSGDHKKDQAAVKEAAEQVVSVVNLHRKDIASLRQLEVNLVQDLLLGEKPVWKRDDKGNLDVETVPMNPIEKAIALNNLTNVQNRRIQLERQAYNLNDLATSIEDLNTVRIINPSNATFIMKDEEEQDG